MLSAKLSIGRSCNDGDCGQKPNHKKPISGETAVVENLHSLKKSNATITHVS